MAAGSQTPVACRPVQGQEGDYVGGTLPDRGARAEPGTESILSTGLALGRVTIGFGSPASRGRGLAGADFLLRSDEDAMAWLHAAANSIRERGRRNSGHAALPAQDGQEQPAPAINA